MGRLSRFLDPLNSQIKSRPLAFEYKRVESGFSIFWGRIPGLCVYKTLRAYFVIKTRVAGYGVVIPAAPKATMICSGTEYRTSK